MNNRFTIIVALAVLLAILIGGYYILREPRVTITATPDDLALHLPMPDNEPPSMVISGEPDGRQPSLTNADVTTPQTSRGVGLMERIRLHQQEVNGPGDLDAASGPVVPVGPAEDAAAEQVEHDPPVWTLDGGTPIRLADADALIQNQRDEPDGAGPAEVHVAAGDADTTASNADPVQPTATTPDRAARAPVDTTPTAYTIDEGDTFSGIALRLFGHERYWVNIAQANPTVDPVRIRPGQVIRLPDAASLDTTSTEAVPLPPPIGVTVYVVKPGDTLITIARRFYDDPSLWRVIYNHNRPVIGVDENRIQIGMRLNIPPKP